MAGFFNKKRSNSSVQGSGFQDVGVRFKDSRATASIRQIFYMIIRVSDLILSEFLT